MTKWIYVLLTFFLFFLSCQLSFADEDRGQPYYDFGIFAFEDGDFEDALSNFQKALSFNPDNPYYHYFLGKTYLALNDDERATLHLKIALGLNPEISGLRYDLAALHFKLAEYKEAVDLFSKVNTDDPNYVMARYYAGISHFKLKDYELAKPHLQIASERSPTIKANGYYYLGICYLKTGDYDRAIGKFSYVRDNTESETLRDNAIKWLAASEGQKKALKPYFLYAKVGYQYDSNILLDPLDKDLPTDEDDHALVSFLLGKYDFVRKGKLTAGASYSHYTVNYETLNEFDLTASMGDIYAHYKMDELRLSLKYLPNYYWVGGKDYQVNHRLRPQLMWKVNDSFDVRGNYTYELKRNFIIPERNGHANFINLDLYHFFFDRHLRLLAGANFEANAADNTDHSYNQLKGVLGVDLKLPWEFKLRLLAKINKKDYLYIDSLYNLKRKDSRWEGTGSLSRKIYFDWLSAVLDYRYTRNDSNIIDANGVQIFDYKREQITFSLSASY